MRSWTPRAASPELRQRIFGQPQRVAKGSKGANVAQAVRLADFSQWLVPVFGCFLLMIGTLSSRYPAHEVYPLMGTNVLLTENSAAYNEAVMARADHSDKNALPTATVEWTFGAPKTATSYSAGPVSYTNKIIQ